MSLITELLETQYLEENKLLGKEKQKDVWGQTEVKDSASDTF